MIKKYKFESTFNPTVVISSLLLCFGVIAVVLLTPATSLSFLESIKTAVFQHFGWFYILLCSAFLFFLFFVSLSRYGDIKLGDDDEEPEFSNLSWFALLFTAGVGVGIIFLGIREPLQHYLNPIDASHLDRSAIFHSIFHWGINVWAIYGMIALAIAFFGFRYKLPLSLRSCFYPLLKDKINGRFGDLIDIFGLCTTIFGVVTMLTYSILRLFSAFNSLGVIHQNNLLVQFSFIGIFAIAVLISMRGLAKGLRLVSELSLGLTLVLLLFILIIGPTTYLLKAFSDNLGYYLSNFIRVGFKSYTYDQSHLSWFNDWTVLFWAWWFAWAPAFGIFIARISRGRTIREFVFGVLLVPSLFFVLWFTVFGNGAIWVDEHLSNGHLGEMLNDNGKLLFAFFDYLPLKAVSITLVSIIIVLFFISSVDFGIYILNNISSKDKSLTTPSWQTMMWGALIASLTFILFNSGGLEALLASMTIFSLPFTLLMVVIAFSLFQGLRLDYDYHNKEVATNTLTWKADNWQTQLDQLMHQTEKKESLSFIKRNVLPAMRELRQELIGKHHFTVQLESHLKQNPAEVLFRIIDDSEREFLYIVRSISHEVSQEILDDDSMPHIQNQTTYTPTVFVDDETSYSIEHLEKEQIMLDILRQYEFYLAKLNNAEIN